MIWAYTGNNGLQIQQAVTTRVSDFIAEHGDMAVERFDGSEATEEQILGAIDAMPFLARRKLIVVRDMGQLANGADVLGQISKTTAESDTVDVVLYDVQPDKRSAYYKALKKLNNFHEYNELDESGAVRWVSQFVKEQDGQISSSDARYLVSRVGIEQQRLSNELQKLLLYAPHITKENIQVLTDEQPNTTIFNLLDAAFSGNAKRALQMYQEQRQQKVEPQAIQAMLVWQLHAVTVAANAPDSMNSKDAASQSGLSPYVFQKSDHIARRMSKQVIYESLDRLRAIDLQSKRQNIDLDDALQYLIVQFAQSTTR